jgi:V8-like Glu-specific endopeptidase
MAKRLLMLAPLVLFYSCAGDPGQDAASPEPGESAAEQAPGVGVEASAWVSSDDGAEAVGEVVSTPGLERRLFAVPETATVVPPAMVDQATATALAREEPQKRRVVGVHIPMASLGTPQWERIEGPQGTSWRLTIVSDGASHLRPHFASLPPEGEGRVVVYGGSAEQPAAVVRPTGTPTGPDVWGPTVEGSVLFVEVVTASGAPPSLVVDTVAVGIPRAHETEGSCYLDPTCYSAWKTAKSAVGMMLFEEDGSTFTCSGSMVVDKSHSGKPYFLTAHHCLSTQSTADTLEVIWKFATSSCHGPVPSFSSRPTTQGSDLKATSSSSDFTLLLLDHKPPSGTTYLGWTTKSLPTNQDITVIHHPDGTFTRISFGRITQTSGNFWRVVYSQSSTEGGSSGSPLLLSTKQIVGQLYAGTASCTNMSGYDKFGKFSVSWTKGLSAFLDK